MAQAGDLAGICEVLSLIAGEAITKGQLVHWEQDDGKWNAAVDTDTGKFAVAIEAASADTVAFLAVVKGPVYVVASAAAIGKGAYVIAATTGLVATVGAIGETTVYGTIVGTALEAFTTSGTQAIEVGLVG